MVLIRVFSHWLPSKTVFQIVFDLMLLFFSMLLAAAWLNREASSALAVIAPYALVFALATTAVNKAIGFYQRDAKRGLTQTLALALVSFLLAVAVAYAIFGVLPRQGVRYEVLQLSALLALGAMVVVRIYAAHGGLGPVLVRRVMVLGTGAEAVAVEQSLRGGDVNVVGFYPVSSNDAPQVPQSRILSGDPTLADITRKLRVDEIIVAVGERRGGGMPLNELLDCKLAGVRVLDLSSYFERALGQVRLYSLRASWLIFGDGFRQGIIRTFVKRVFDVIVATLLIILTLPVMLLGAMLFQARRKA